VILVTGANGLLGGALAARLRRERLEVLDPKRMHNNGCVLDLNRIESTCFPPGIQTAILCAWHGSVLEAANNFEGTFHTNVEGNIKLLQRLRQAGAQVIFVSTSLVFSGMEVSPCSPLTPCCLYAVQKAAVEAALDPNRDAIVRITKLSETLLPRLVDWAGRLRSRGHVAAAGHLRVAPVMLQEVVEGLVGFARDFEPGVYQMSGLTDYSYLDLAKSMAARVGGSTGDDPQAGSKELLSFPLAGRLEIAAPSRSSSWPSGQDHVPKLIEIALQG